MEEHQLVELSNYQKCFSTNRTWPKMEDKLIAAIPLLAVTSLAFTLNSLIIITIIRYFQELTDKIRINFLLMNLCIAHCLYLSGTFLVQAPAALAPYPIYGTEALMIALTAISSIGFYAIVFFEFAVAVDRFAVFYFTNKKLSYQFYSAFVLTLWFLSISAVCLQIWHKCPKRYNQWQLSYSFECNSGCGGSIAGIFPLSILLNIGTYLTYLVFGLYFLVFLKILQLKSMHQSKLNAQKKEFFVLLQFFVIFLCTWLSTTSMFAFPTWFGRSLFTNIGPMILIAANALLDAALLIIFNSSLRFRIITLMGLKNKCKIITISTNASGHTLGQKKSGANQK